jgi:hypothetical protein
MNEASRSFGDRRRFDVHPVPKILFLKKIH